MELAQGRPFFRPMGPSVDNRSTHAADSLPAVIIKRDRVPAFKGKLLVDGIQKLNKRHVGRYVFNGYLFKTSLIFGSLLAPNFQGDVYCFG